MVVRGGGGDRDPVNLDTREPMIDTLGVLETAALLRELTAGLIAVTDFDEALNQLVRIAGDAVDGVTSCGFTALRAGEPAGVAASDPRLAELDDLRHGPDSPAMSAVHRREMITAQDLDQESRWPACHGTTQRRGPVDRPHQLRGWRRCSCTS